jgi:diguanylate cyclase (GGDEF)-like protein/PAS domain S-box-containing protein
MRTQYLRDNENRREAEDGYGSVKPLADDGRVKESRLPDNSSEEKMRLFEAFASSESIVALIDPVDRRIIDVNPALERATGYRREEVIGRPASEFGLWVDAGLLERSLNGDLHSPHRLFDAAVSIACVDGRALPGRLHAEMVSTASGPRLFCLLRILPDDPISVQAKTEEALRLSQNLYRVLLDNSHDGIFLVQRGIVQFANQAMADIFGYALDELFGLDYLSLIDSQDYDVQRQRRQSREQGSRELQMYEVRMIRKDGRSILCQVRADAVDYRGHIASTGTLRDVTQERQRQRAIADAEQRYRELFEDSPAGLFRANLEGEIVEVNPALSTMLGYRSPEQLKAVVGKKASVHYDPAERKMLTERALRDGSFSHYETRFVDADGMVRWVIVSVRLIRDEHGQPLHFTGSVLDTQDRHEMQQALLSSENKYRTLVEQSHVGVFIMVDGRYTYANRALADMLGIGEDELIGKSHQDLLAPEAGQKPMREPHRSNDLPQTEYESCLLHRSGRRVYVRISTSPIELDGVEHTTGTILDITRQREAEAHLRFRATHDSLTGLANRALFNRKLADRLSSRFHPDGSSYAVIFFDLDGFKSINDSLGHGAGDRLLQEISRRFEREMAGDALIARYGGDEFTVLPEGVCDQERILSIAQRILALFERPFDISGQQVFSSASLGIVLGRVDYETPDQVLRDADTAMYRAKAAGKSGFVVFDEAMHTEARWRLQIVTDFRLAFERGEFMLYYQPVVDLSSGRLVGAEALVRWRHPQRGVIEPTEFLPIATDTGLIAELDRWVLREACRQLELWRSRHPTAADFRMSVNVDERQLASSEMIDDVSQLLRAHHLPPSCLRLEVTETVFRSGSAHAQDQLQALKDLGIGLAVDDFGTGYSSLESFAASSFDTLKVDQSFIRDLTTNPRHRAIVRTIINFAKDLSLNLTAEGIETEDQRALLIELGCDYGQGYLFAKPLPSEEFERRL